MTELSHILNMPIEQPFDGGVTTELSAKTGPDFTVQALLPGLPASERGMLAQHPDITAPIHRGRSEGPHRGIEMCEAKPAATGAVALAEAVEVAHDDAAGEVHEERPAEAVAALADEPATEGAAMPAGGGGEPPIDNTSGSSAAEYPDDGDESSEDANQDGAETRYLGRAEEHLPEHVSRVLSDRPAEHTGEDTFEYIAAIPEVKSIFLDQLRQLGELAPAAVVIGSVARLAMYADAGVPVDQPTTLVSRSMFYPYNEKPRDIDVVDPSSAGLQNLKSLGPHPVDETLNRLFDHSGDPAIGVPQENAIPVDPRIFATRTRMLEGVPVRTFTYGTQFFVDRLLRGPSERIKYESQREEFAKFISQQRRDHPEEFLPDESYEPFRQLNPNAGHLPDGDPPEGRRIKK